MNEDDKPALPALPNRPNEIDEDDNKNKKPICKNISFWSFISVVLFLIYQLSRFWLNENNAYNLFDFFLEYCFWFVTSNHQRKKTNEKLNYKLAGDVSCRMPD